MHRKLAIGHEHWTGMARKLVLSCVWKQEEDRENQISGGGKIWKGTVTERERKRETQKEGQLPRYSGLLHPPVVFG